MVMQRLSSDMTLILSFTFPVLFLVWQCYCFFVASSFCAEWRWFSKSSICQTLSFFWHLVQLVSYPCSSKHFRKIWIFLIFEVLGLFISFLAVRTCHWPWVCPLKAITPAEKNYSETIFLMSFWVTVLLEVIFYVSDIIFNSFSSTRFFRT